MIDDLSRPLSDQRTDGRLSSSPGSDVEQLPPPNELRPLLARDAARILQADAPLTIMGAWPDAPKLFTKRVLAVSEGDLDQECDALHACLDQFMAQRDAAVDVSKDGHPVAFHLDGPRFPSWAPMRRHDGFRSLQLDQRLSVRIADT